MARDAEPQPHERAEQERDRDHADKPPLLTDRRENEVGVRIRQIAEFLLALPKPRAEQLARADATPRARKCPILAPAVNITLPASSATSRAIERWGSRKIRPVTGTRMTTNGNTPFLKSRTCSPFLAASMAHHTTTANFASSEGCSVNTPRFTQRRAPLIVGVMACVNGSSGIISNTAVTPSSGHAQRRQR